MKRQDIPNVISIFRIIAVLPVVWILLNEWFGVALILFALAGASDGLDGFLAKHYHWESRLGSILDPLADKLLLVASFASLTWLELIPAWLLWLVLARDVVIVTGGVLYHYLLGQFKLLPLWSSKINTLLQLLLVLFIIWQQYTGAMNDKWATFGVSVVAVSVLISGAEYIFVWGRKAWHHNNRV